MIYIQKLIMSNTVILFIYFWGFDLVGERKYEQKNRGVKMGNRIDALLVENMVPIIRGCREDEMKWSKVSN